MGLLGSILSLLGGAMKGIGSWVESYCSKENTKARVENDKTKKEDEFHNEIKNHDIDAERRRLS